MEISARNVFRGKVKQIAHGAVNAEVTIVLAGGQEIVAIITESSVARLALAEGREAYAVVKASDVMIAVD